MEKVLYELIDRWGQLYVYDDKIVIERKGGNAFWYHGWKGGKTIPISSITSVQFKPIKFNGGPNGYIQFGILGGVESGKGAWAAQRDENTIFFRWENREVAQQIREFIEQKIANQQKQPTVVQQTSAADELKKFKELLDSGVITQEEFDAKKKHLLGL